jgi:hypothetical protein
VAAGADRVLDAILLNADSRRQRHSSEFNLKCSASLETCSAERSFTLLLKNRFSRFFGIPVSAAISRTGLPDRMIATLNSLKVGTANYPFDWRTQLNSTPTEY